MVRENGSMVRIDPNQAMKREALAKTLLTPPSETVGSRPVTGTKKVSHWIFQSAVLKILEERFSILED